MADVQVESPRRRPDDLEARAAGFWKRRRLPQLDACVPPGQRRGDEQVDVQRVTLRSAGGAAEVDRVAVLRVVLHAGARAAPERIEGGAEQFDVSRTR